VGFLSFLFGFSGRINRLQYWGGSLGVGFGAGFIFFFIGFMALPQPGTSKDAALMAAPLLLLLMGVLGIAVGWAGLALQVKRFHDRNQPGWLCLLPVLPMMGLMSTGITGVLQGQALGELAGSMQPFVLALWAINLFFFINLGCLAGTDGPNKYGPPPGSGASPQSDPSPRTRAPAEASFSLGGVEAAMERAIAEKARQAPAPVKTARPATAGAASAPAAPSSFGRRPAAR